MLKHLLFAAAVATAAFTANAQVIFEGSHTLTWSDALTISSDKFASIEAGDQIKAYFKVTDSYANLWFVLNVENWPKMKNIEESTNLTPAESGSYYGSSVTESAITVAESDIDGLKNGGLVLQGTNMDISKVEIIPASEVPAANVWTGNFESGSWNGGLTIPASLCKNLKEGDKITFEFTVGDLEDNGNLYGKILIKDTSWQDLPDINSTFTNVNDYNSFVPGTTTSTATVDAANAEYMVANGCIIQGHNVTITKIIFGDDNAQGGDDQPGTGDDQPTTGNVIFEGEKAITWSDALIIQGTKFANIKAGDQVKATFEVTGDYGNLEFEMNVENWPRLANNDDRTNVTPSESGAYYGATVTESAVTVAESDIENLKSAGMVIQGNYVTVTKVEIIPATVEDAAVEAIVDNNAPVEYYNLQGVRVNEPAKGTIVIRRQGSEVKKVIF